jgi:YegS/Rv2252/BmrU family lipid kinase
VEPVAAEVVALLIRRALLIANPASRRGRFLSEVACRELTRRGIAVDVAFTERPGHAGEIAGDRASAYDVVFTLGGDGTVMEVAGALAGTGLPIAVLPGGTGNLIARALGIPFRVERAIAALTKGSESLIDLGRLDSGRRFAIAAGVGIDSIMIAETPSWLKRRLGVLAYTIMGSRAALRAVVKREFFHARLTVDGIVHERQAAAVMIANFGAVLGERIILGPDIRTDDGFLDGCIFSPRSMFDAFRIMWRLLRHDFRSDPCVLYCRGRDIRVETTPHLPAQADGELLGMTPFHAVVEPLAARLLVPASH